MCRLDLSCRNLRRPGPSNRRSRIEYIGSRWNKTMGRQSGHTAGPADPALLAAAAAVADDGIGRPEQRMTVGEKHFSLVVSETFAVKKRQHGLPQRLAARQLRIGGLAPEEVADEFLRRLRVD